MTTPDQPVRKSWPRRHKILTGLGILAALFLIGSIFGNSGGPASQSPAAAPYSSTFSVPSASSTPAAVAATSAPAVTQTRTVFRVIFVARGYAPGGADITYGSDTDNRSPQGGLGFDGSGTALPWTASLRFHRNAMWYDVSAQLQGSGDIRCAVILQGTRYYSDGTHQTVRKVMAHGHASGGYNICDAQANND